MPLRLSERDARRAFVGPLEAMLEELQFGRVTRVEIVRSEDVEPTGLAMTLSVDREDRWVLEMIARKLEELDAPEGSWIGTAEHPRVLGFGKTAGLCLYLDSLETEDDSDMLDIVEACTDALDGRGFYQGSSRLGDRRALYFYGDSFNAMRKAMTFVISTDPRCQNAMTSRIG